MDSAFLICKLIYQKNAATYAEKGSADMLKRFLKQKIRKGSKVLIPRTGGHYSEGSVVWIAGDKAEVSFPVGLTYRGMPSSYDPDELAYKVVPINKLKVV